MRYHTKLLQLDIADHLQISPCVWLLVHVDPGCKARCRIGEFIDVISHCDQLSLVAGRHAKLLELRQLCFISGRLLKKDHEKEKGLTPRSYSSQCHC